MGQNSVGRFDDNDFLSSSSNIALICLFFSIYFPMYMHLVRLDTFLMVFYLINSLLFVTMNPFKHHLIFFFKTSFEILAKILKTKTV